MEIVLGLLGLIAGLTLMIGFARGASRALWGGGAERAARNLYDRFRR